MPGITIGKDSIIAAGSVVTKSVPEGSIVAGNPAKIISSIDKYNEKVKGQILSSKVYGKDYTINGNITSIQKTNMYNELCENIGFVK